MVKGVIDYYTPYDQLESALTKLDSVATKLDNVATKLDNVASKLDTTIARLDTTITKLDSILTSTNTNTYANWSKATGSDTVVVDYVSPYTFSSTIRAHPNNSASIIVKKGGVQVASLSAGGSITLTGCEADISLYGSGQYYLCEVSGGH